MLLTISVTYPASAQQSISLPTMLQTDSVQIISAEKKDANTVVLLLSNKHQMLLQFYSASIFRLFYDKTGGMMRDPVASPPAKILVDQPHKSLSKLEVTNSGNEININIDELRIVLNKASTFMKVFNSNNNLVLETAAPVQFTKNQVALKLKEAPNEFFYGGGVQNGRFSHKGKRIAIENQNSWTDGGVASPTPFYWSTNGYGVMWHTFKKGKYDFGLSEKGFVNLSHEEAYLDVFFMVGHTPVALLNHFYQLTGHPVLVPKFGFYQGHLNAYNRDYWTEDSTGILFEDGRRYKENQKDNGGIKESLNGETRNYPFSARAVIDRYKAHDMPLGWILPNDGYGAGYGQTGTLDSNILNLRSFGDYARAQGVQIGLWTQSDLHPKEGISALLQRDIVKEVGVAGVRVLKTDVAWVGPGYSFGLNGVADAAQIMSKQGGNARPFIISLDGWAGTQRYATIWSGDQTGGQWEYIRFHIPTYLGSGISGQPNISSDMDGIFGGKNTAVNIRDFQWKTFTPMQLNMDGWGSNEKYPHALGEPATSINRMYLKWKSALLPYTYSIAKEAVNGLPMVRALFLEYPNSYTWGKATQYQFLYGPSFLIAPIYKNTKADASGNDIRNGIYLPKGIWIDYFDGAQYEGDQILNHFDAPIWKLPVFVKSGAIIPLIHPNNNVAEINKELRIYELYPAGQSTFTEYDDDGTTEAYKEGKGTTTQIESSVEKMKATITVHPTKGTFDGFINKKATEFRINVTSEPTAVRVKVGSKNIKLKKATSQVQFLKGENVYFFDAAPNLNKFATKGTEFGNIGITKNPQLLVKVAASDITKNAVVLTVDGFQFNPVNILHKTSGALTAPLAAQVRSSNLQAYSLQPSWSNVPNADYYEILFNGQRYSTIKDTTLLFEDLQPETSYTFQVRSVNKTGFSPWMQFTAKTRQNPLEFAVKGIVSTSTAADQGGSGVFNLFDFDESSMWHTRWSAKAVPFDLVIDMMSVNQIEKMQYLPRERGNGILLKGTIAYSADKNTWSEAVAFEWANNGSTKEFLFNNQPTARYIKIRVSEAVGGFGSGREMYVFKVPGSESYIPGDINNDKHIDNNDLTSYLNYTGLRSGDPEFEGYVSKGDVNKNGLIDAYDISTVAIQLTGGAHARQTDSLSGNIELNAPKKRYSKNEIIEISVKGTNLKSVNALSFALPYPSQDFDFVSITPIGMKGLENMTSDRTHSNGSKALYPTFVNMGEQKVLEGTMELFVIRLRAKRSVSLNLKSMDGLLVDKHLNVMKF